MNELRWILLLLAIAVFTGTLLWSRFSRESKARDMFSEKHRNKDNLNQDVVYADDDVEIDEDFGVSEVRLINPSTDLHSLDVSQTQKSQLSDQMDSASQSQEPAEDELQYITVIHVTAKAGETFKSKKICKTLEHLGLKHGKYQIYHRESLQNPDVSLFSVANMVKPGYFEPNAEESFTTPGISFFLVLPGPPDPLTTFNEMLQTAKQVLQASYFA